MTSFGPAARLAALLILLLSMAWLSPTAAIAQDDSRVWVNTNSGVYHCPGTQYYGNTKRGKYLSESDATASGYRAAYGKRCSAAAQRAPQPVARQALAAQPDGNDAKVWVNSSSRVYHCPVPGTTGTPRAAGTCRKPTPRLRATARPTGRAVVDSVGPARN